MNLPGDLHEQQWLDPTPPKTQHGDYSVFCIISSLMQIFALLQHTHTKMCTHKTRWQQLECKIATELKFCVCFFKNKII